MTNPCRPCHSLANSGTAHAFVTCSQRIDDISVAVSDTRSAAIDQSASARLVIDLTATHEEAHVLFAIHRRIFELERQLAIEDLAASAPQTPSQPITARFSQIGHRLRILQIPSGNTQSAAQFLALATGEASRSQ